MKNLQLLDWLGVGVVVMGAAAWLFLHFRRRWKRRKACAENGAGACDSGCDGCPFSKSCGFKNRP